MLVLPAVACGTLFTLQLTELCFVIYFHATLIYFFHIILH